MSRHQNIQILLSSYNGEKYIREQLDSFIHLDCYDRAKVLIRDDGSTDSTPSILKEYADKYGFGVLYGSNKGINASYGLLFKAADLSCDYFAFADQDDVWLPNKLSRGIQLLSSINVADIPLLYGSRVEIVDENLRHLGYSPIYKKGASFYNAVIQNILPGHTMILNRTLFKKILDIPTDHDIITDWLIYMIGSGIGHTVYDDAIGVMHRQHGNNAIGFEQQFLKNTLKRIKRFNKGKVNQNSVQIKAFYEKYSDLLPEHYRQEIGQYLNSLQNIFKRTLYATACKAYRQTAFENLLFKVLYILGKYNLK